MSLYEQSAFQIAEQIKDGSCTAEQVTQSVLERIALLEPKVQAYAHLDEQAALSQARAVDQKRQSGESLGLLAGVPVALKDNMCMKGRPVSCSSKIFHGQSGPYIPPYNATAVEKLLAQDAVVLGAANMDEFAMGSSTETSALKQTRNPWDLQRVPGGSSGGSAAAVAADLAAIALGSDTGGSIRQPAAFCGVVGLKPIYGEVSRFGLIAFASSLDQIGPLSKDVRDAALMMDVIAGHDPQDSTSIAESEGLYSGYQGFLNQDVRGLKIGVPEDSYQDAVDQSVRDALDKAIETYKSLGADVQTVSLPHSKYAVAVYYILATAEASANLARYDGIQYGMRKDSGKGLKDLYLDTRSEGFGQEVKRRILLGTYVLSSGYYDAYYKKAQRVRSLIKQDFDNLFKQQGFDALLMPTSPTPPFKAGERTEDPLQMYLSDIFTISANLAGIPAMSFPAGLSAEGLPIGLQLASDAQAGVGLKKLFGLAHAFEQNSGLEKSKPNL